MPNQAVGMYGKGEEVCRFIGLSPEAAIIADAAASPQLVECDACRVPGAGHGVRVPRRSAKSACPAETVRNALLVDTGACIHCWWWCHHPRD